MARQLIIHILHYQFNLCTPALSRYVNINLRGVKRANEKITNMLKYDSNFRAEYQAILDKIKSGAHWGTAFRLKIWRNWKN